MTTVTFDTLQLADKLKAAGIAPEQAEAVVRVILEAQNQLLTKADLGIALSAVRTDLAVLKWMMGVLLAGVLSLILRTFLLDPIGPTWCGAPVRPRRATASRTAAAFKLAPFRL